MKDLAYSIAKKQLMKVVAKKLAKIALKKIATGPLKFLAWGPVGFIVTMVLSKYIVDLIKNGLLLMQDAVDGARISYNFNQVEQVVKHMKENYNELSAKEIKDLNEGNRKAFRKAMEVI